MAQGVVGHGFSALLGDVVVADILCNGLVNN